MLETADLVKFTEEILNGKFHFLCSVRFKNKLRRNQDFTMTVVSALLNNLKYVSLAMS